MPTIRDLFHKIGNQHNKISVSAGVLRENTKRKPLTDLSKQELREGNTKFISSLDEIEKTALNADKILNELRQAIYKLVNPDRQIAKGGNHD